MTFSQAIAQSAAENLEICVPKIKDGEEARIQINVTSALTGSHVRELTHAWECYIFGIRCGHGVLQSTGQLPAPLPIL